MNDVEIARHLFEISLSSMANGVAVKVSFADTGVIDWDIRRHRQTTVWEWSDAEESISHMPIPPAELMVMLHPRILSDPEALRDAYAALYQAVVASVC